MLWWVNSISLLLRRFGIQESTNNESDPETGGKEGQDQRPSTEGKPIADPKKHEKRSGQLATDGTDPRHLHTLANDKLRCFIRFRQSRGTRIGTRDPLAAR
jgi:hypothetical protein